MILRLLNEILKTEGAISKDNPNARAVISPTSGKLVYVHKDRY